MKNKRTLLVVLALTTTQAAFAAIPAALPEFKTGAQLDVWRAESSAQAAVQSASHPATFFTGKPYVESAGGYAFRYRNFNPGLGRWGSADPSGFPDGANNHIYASSPTNGLDPYGLKWVFAGSNSTAGEYSDTFSAPVDIDGQYSGKVSISGFSSNGEATSLTVSIEAGTSIEGWFQSASAPISKSFTLNINETSGEVTMSGVTEFTKRDSAWSLGHISSSYNAGIEDGTNVVQGKVAFGHGYSGWGEVEVGYEGEGLSVGVTLENIDWSFPTAISFSVNKKEVE
jgi:RHS repeat-associated protein